MMENVNKRWCTLQLSDICFISSGFAFKSNSFKNTGIPVIKISDIQQERVSSINSVRVNAELNDFEEKFLVHKGDILIAMSGATTGKMGIYTDDEVSLLNQRVGNFLFYCDDKDFKKYVYYYLNLIAKDILKQAWGAAQPNIGKSQLENIKINLPPLAEQKRIVAKIESLFSRLDSAKSSLERVQHEIKRYRQSVLKAAFEGKLVKFSNKSKKNLREIAEVKGGKRLPKGNSVQDEKTCYPYIRVTDFNEYSVDVGKLKYITQSIFKKISRYIINKDDVYISIAGTIGSVGMIPAFLDGANLTENAAKITKLKQLDPKFLMFYLSSYRVQRVIDKLKKATSQPKLALYRIHSISIEYPVDMKEQKQVVYAIESRFKRVKLLEDVVEQGLTKIEQLKQSILKKAFEGKLVESDLNDESVEELLKRIDAVKGKNNER